MNAIRIAALIVLSTSLAALVGCTSSPSPSVAHDDQIAAGIPYGDSPCNLGEESIPGGVGAQSRYVTPDVDPDLVEEYGSVVANDSCSDDAILAWQEMRRSEGHSDQICRVVWHEDAIGGMVYPIGCAAPAWVVRDDAR